MDPNIPNHASVRTLERLILHWPNSKRIQLKLQEAKRKEEESLPKGNAQLLFRA